MSSSSTSATALVLSVLWLAACSSDGATEAGWEAACRVRCGYDAERIVSLGDDSTGIIGPGAALTRIGEFYYVADQYDRSAIKVFDRRAGYVGRIGREGEGPEEFRSILDLDTDSLGNLWALDGRNGRITLIQPSGSSATFSTIFRLPEAASRPQPRGLTVLADGTALLNSAAFVNNVRGSPSHLLDPDSGLRWSVTEEALPSESVRDPYRPYAVDSEGGFWTARGEGVYRLEYRRLSDGTLIRAIEPRRRWYDEHSQAVPLPTGSETPPGEQASLQPARVVDLALEGDQLWVLGSYHGFSRAVIEVFSATAGRLLFATELPFDQYKGYFGFDDDGHLIEFEGSTKGSRVNLWDLSLPERD